MTDPGTTWWRESTPRMTYGGGIAGDDSAGSALPFWSLVAFTFILLLAPQVWFPVLAPLRIALLTAAVALGAHAFSRLSRGRPLLDFTPPLVAVSVLVAWAVLAVPFSLWPGGSVEYLLDHYFKTLAGFVLLAHVVSNLSRLQIICWALVLMSVPLALTTVQNYLSGITLGDSSRVVGYSAGLTANPNDMALMLNLILPVCTALFLAERKASNRLLLGAIFLLLVLAIILTFSRAGFLTLGVSVLCWLWLLRKRPERIWFPVLFVLALAALPLVPATYLERIMTIVAIEDDTSNSAQTRLGDIKVAVKVVMAHPVIGAGPGMNALAMNAARGTTWTEVHNVYLQTAVELGLPGLLLFLVFYGRCMGAVRAVLRRTQGRQQHRYLFCIAEGIQVSLIAFAVAAMFHPAAYHFYFYCMAGLALAASRVCKEQEATLGQPLPVAAKPGLRP